MYVCTYIRIHMYVRMYIRTYRHIYMYTCVCVFDTECFQEFCTLSKSNMVYIYIWYIRNRYIRNIYIYLVKHKAYFTEQ